MWVNQIALNKHVFINYEGFDIIYFIEDAWRNNDPSLSNLILFNKASSWYIADLESDIDDLGFDNDYFANVAFTNQGRVYKENGDWILNRGYTNDLRSNSPIWKKSEAKGFFNSDVIAIGSKFKLNQPSMEWEPWPVADDSEDLSSYNFGFASIGESVYKSSSKLGVYKWQGSGTKADIIVGYRKYTHKAIDAEGNQTNEDVEVIETSSLVEETANNWIYTYNGVRYKYSGELPLNNFAMTSDDSKTLQMNYVGLTTLVKGVNIFDGGAQIVD